MRLMIKRFVITLFLFVLMAVPALAADVPVGYTILEYIQSSGTQYVDTGFVPNNNSRVFIDIEPLESETFSFFGARKSNTDSSFCFFLIYNNTYRSDYGSTNQSVSVSSTLKRVVIDKNKNQFSIDGVSYSNTPATFNSSFPLYLLTNNYNGSSSGETIGSAKIYSCQIYNNGTLVRDYVPVINTSGVTGLWDKVNGEFVGNSGTGSFISGPAVEIVKPSYSVSVSSGGNGSASASVTSAKEGDLVTLSATPDEGYHFVDWEVLSGGITISNNQFIMPAADVSVRAIFEADIPPVYYTITVQTNGNGSASASAISAVEGALITLSATPDDGYVFDGWTVVSGGVTISGSTFTMPSNDVVVRADFSEWVPTPSDNEYYSNWTDIELYQLFSTDADVFSVGIFSSDGAQGGEIYRGFGSFFWWDEWYSRDTNYDGVTSAEYNVFLGGKVLMPGNYYRLRFFLQNFTYDNMGCYTTDGEYIGRQNINFIASDLKTYSRDEYNTTSYYDCIVTVNSPCVITFVRPDSNSYRSLDHGLTGTIALVQPTASGDSFSGTASDIENNSNQLTQIENDILTDLEIYSAQVNPLDINFGSGIVNAMSFISSTWTNAFGQLGELQSVVTFPLFLGLALLFIGRASSVIVSGSMKSQRNNDKKGGGDIG